MNDVHFMDEKIDIKNEPENRITCEVQAEKIVFYEARVKCGDVIVGCQGNFTLICSFCKDDFITFDSFGLHIKNRHMGVKPEPEVPIEHIITEPLIEWDDTFAPRSSSRKRAIRNDCEDRISSSNYSRAQLEPVTETSKAAFNNSLYPNQHGENTEVKLGEELVKSGDQYTPEDEVGSKKQTLRTKKEYFCIHCGRTYISKKRFIVHSKKEHNYTPEAANLEAPGMPLTEPVKIVCRYCDKSFDDQINFKSHMSTHTGVARFACPFCPKLFRGRPNRDYHINTHTGERPFKCTHCSKAFSDQRNLEKHIRMHLGVMKFSCDYCDKRFVQSTEKKLHERVHTGDRPFQCEECGRRFIAHAQLTQHSRRHKNIKNYKCKVCSKEFYTSVALKDHITTHTGERPFHCDICFQAFSRRKSFLVHKQIHSNEKKYVCCICGKAFAQYAGLYSHKKSHEAKESL